MAKDDKSIALRDTELSSGTDIGRRVAFLFSILGPAIGGVLIVASLVQKSFPIGIVGLNLLIISGLLITLRHKLGLSNVKAELEKNPIKPTRVPKE